MHDPRVGLELGRPSGYDSWSAWYDAVYMQGPLGVAYAELTEQQLKLVFEACSGREGGFLDVGAGTGRLSVPVASHGIRVTAVEPSRGMVAELRLHAARAGVAHGIHVVEACAQSIPHGSVRSDHDVAACVFSTIHHVLEEVELDRSLEAMASAVRSSGTVLIGVHPPELFAAFRNPIAHRLRPTTPEQPVSWSQVAVSVHSRSGLLDICCELGFTDGSKTTDRLRLRTWTVAQVTEAARRIGLFLETDFGMVGPELLLGFRRAEEAQDVRTHPERSSTR
jgi:SAM-dependent methyltransferase